MHLDLPDWLLKYDFEPQSILDKIFIYSFRLLTLFLLKQNYNQMQWVHMLRNQSDIELLGARAPAAINEGFLPQN